MRDEGDRRMAVVWSVAAVIAALTVAVGLLYDHHASANAMVVSTAVHKPPVAVPAVREPDAGMVPAEVVYSDDVEAHARLVANEEGLANRSRPGIGTYLIGAVLRRNAGYADVSIAQIVARNHWRHTRAGRKTGSWIPGLSKSLERPAEWPEHAIPWYTSVRGQAGWKARLDEARAFESGEVELVCPVAYPRHWGGPVTDGQRLFDQLESGRVIIVAGPPIPPVPRLVMTAEGRVPMRDDAGNVIMRVEQPGWRVEPCYVELENGERVTASRNVFLARLSDIR